MTAFYAVIHGGIMAVERSDEELAVLSRTDKDAMNELLSRYTVVAYAKAWAISPEYYEDLFQEGLMGCLAAAKTYDPDKGASFATYANRCIKNRMINAIKKLDSVLEEPLDEETESMCADKSELIPYNIIEQKERAAEINKKAAMVLSNKEWRVFRLFSVGLSYEAIGSELGMTPKQVNNAMQRARKKLRAELGNI